MTAEHVSSELIHHDDVVVSVHADVATHAHINKADYERLYRESVENPEGFWSKQAELLDWMQPFKQVKDTQFGKEVSIDWFKGGKLNVSANCIDRHLKDRADKTAIIWEQDEPGKAKHITYQELHDEVCQLANGLKEQGVKKGDRVIIYMPMVPQAAYAMLACTRIGAIHSVVFGGFSPEALKGRIVDCKANTVITADCGVRGGKAVPLKDNVDQALALGAKVDRVVVYRATGADINWDESRDVDYKEITHHQSQLCEPEAMDAEDPLFILYTSGSTGKPKGVLHSSAGYLLYSLLTFKYVFDYREDDIYWCTADVGWITGHSYIVYGPLACGATTVMFEGVPHYPNWSRCWDVIDQHKVTAFYTAPTAIRAMMREGDQPVTTTSRSSLRLLGTVGEPINPEAWNWYYKVVGQSRCPIVDTWWQTETGGHMITPLIGATDLKPGSATKPFFGVQPVLVNEQNQLLEGEAEGALCIADSWPGQARSVYGDHARFVETYFTQYSGRYFSGDGARRDRDGYYWITGRMDDVLNVSGHRLGTAEIESALVAHQLVAEAAVVGIPHEIKGEGIYAYVTLVSGFTGGDDLAKELTQWVRKEIGPIATIDRIQFASGLPKTRSGKIMRRILRKIACGETEDFGDTNTLTNPEVVEELLLSKG